MEVANDVPRADPHERAVCRGQYRAVRPTMVRAVLHGPGLCVDCLTPVSVGHMAYGDILADADGYHRVRVPSLPGTCYVEYLPIGEWVRA